MTVPQIIAQTLLAVIAVVLLARSNGLRSFSKMSSFDFALTVATGSVLAGMMTASSGPWPGLVALVTLFVLRFVISKARQRFEALQTLTDNTPLMLMYEGKVLPENLALARVSRSDLRSKLREANALRLDAVRAVVFEATGDVSVLHGQEVDAEMLHGVSWGNARVPEDLRAPPDLPNA